MAKRIFNVDIDMDQNELKNVVIDQLATDPVSPVKGQIWYNTTVNEIKYYDGTTIEIIADRDWVTTQINSLGQNQGSFSAVPGALPTAANKTVGDLTTIKRGDFWVISAAGTIAGIGGGSTYLSVGDILQFTGSNPATASDWLGIQRNVDDRVIGNAKTEEQTVNLVANTQLTITAATLSKVFSVVTINSTGDKIELDQAFTGTDPQVLLTSKKSLTGVKVRLIGAA